MAQHVENEWKVRLDTTDARLDKCARELVSSLQDEGTQNDLGGFCTLIELNSHGDTRMKNTLICYVNDYMEQGRLACLKLSADAVTFINIES